MPRPVTISALPVLVVTVVRWISPRSTVACTVPGSLFRRHNVHADVQLEAPVPDERTRPGIVRERERQHQGWVTLTHRQDDAALSRSPPSPRET